MIGGLVVLLLASPAGAAPDAAAMVRGQLARCAAAGGAGGGGAGRAGDGGALARCVAPSVDLERYADRVLVDVVATATDAAALGVLRAAVASRVAARLEGQLAAHAHLDVRRACVVRPAASAASAAPVASAVRVELSCGAHTLILLGSIARGDFRVEDAEIDGALISRSHRAEVNKAVRRGGLAGLAARLQRAGATPRRLELGIAP